MQMQTKTNAGNQTGEHDFDFFFGHWNVSHRYLKERLVGCTEWIEFGGRSICTPTLGGAGNIDDNVLCFPSGDARAVTIRAFDPGSGTWSIWWLSAKSPKTIDVPVVGKFTDGIGSFFAEEVINGKNVLVRFLWNTQTADYPTWEQAFSLDNGNTWEVNWVMTFSRASFTAL